MDQFLQKYNLPKLNQEDSESSIKDLQNSFYYIQTWQHIKTYKVYPRKDRFLQYLKSVDGAHHTHLLRYITTVDHCAKLKNHAFKKERYSKQHILRAPMYMKRPKNLLWGKSDQRLVKSRPGRRTEIGVWSSFRADRNTLSLDLDNDNNSDVYQNPSHCTFTTYFL